MQLSLQLSKLQGTTSYFDGNMGRVGVKSDTVRMLERRKKLKYGSHCLGFYFLFKSIVGRCVPLAA